MTDYGRLKNIIINTLWMARRYAHNRCTYAPTAVNEAIDECKELGIHIDPDTELGMYADDGMFGQWNPEIKRFEKQ